MSCTTRSLVVGAVLAITAASGRAIGGRPQYWLLARRPQSTGIPGRSNTRLP